MINLEPMSKTPLLKTNSMMDQGQTSVKMTKTGFSHTFRIFIVIFVNWILEISTILYFDIIISIW